MDSVSQKALPQVAPSEVAHGCNKYNVAMINRIGERARFHSLALGVWCLFLVAGLAIVDDYGVSAGGGGKRVAAPNAVNYVLHGDPPLLQIDADHFYGAAFELALFLLTERALGLEDPRHVHLARQVLTRLLFLIGGFCCYLLAFRLSGNRLAALLVMLLFLLSPRLYAHSFFNSKDAAFASVFAMALLFASRAFDKDSLGAYRWCGAMAGFLVHLRIMGIALFAVVLVFRLWAWFRAEGPAARRRATATAGVFALWGGVVLFISLPYLWSDPRGFDARLHGKRLAWVKETCEPEALRRPFRLTLYPVDASRASPRQQQQDNHVDHVYGVPSDGKCLWITRLPDFALARIRLEEPVSDF